jgi:8-oxo-dGTP diphosphatase
MAKKKYTYNYPRPCVTVDVVLLTKEAAPRVLLIRRGGEPFAGAWALPGGFVNMDETLEKSARRELEEETGLKVGELTQLHTFGDPGRDPRSRTISVVYLGYVHASSASATAGDDASEVRWFPLRRPPELAFDHGEILTLARAAHRAHMKAHRRGRQERSPK